MTQSTPTPNPRPLCEPFTLIQTDPLGKLVLQLEPLQIIFHNPQIPIVLVTLMGKTKWRRLMARRIQISLSPTQAIRRNFMTGEEKRFEEKSQRSAETNFITLTPFSFHLVKGQGNEKFEMAVFLMEIHHLNDQNFNKLIDLISFYSSLTFQFHDEEKFEFQSMAPNSNILGLSERFPTTSIFILKPAGNSNSEENSKQEMKESNNLKRAPSASSRLITWYSSFLNLLEEEQNKLPIYLRDLMDQFEIDPIRPFTKRSGEFKFGFVTGGEEPTGHVTHSSVESLLTAADFAQILQQGLSSICQGPAVREVDKIRVKSPRISEDEEEMSILDDLKSPGSSQSESWENISLVEFSKSSAHDKTENSQTPVGGMETTEMAAKDEFVVITIDDVTQEMETTQENDAEIIDEFQLQFTEFIQDEANWNLIISKYSTEFDKRLTFPNILLDDEMRQVHANILLDLWVMECLKIHSQFHDNYFHLLSSRLSPIFGSFFEGNRKTTTTLVDLYSEIYNHIALNLEYELCRQIQENGGPEQIKMVTTQTAMFRKFKSLLRDIQEKFGDWYTSELGACLDLINQKISALQFYAVEFKSHLQRFVAMSCDNFDSCHAHVLAQTIESFPFPQSSEFDSNSFFEKAVEFMRAALFSTNESIFAEEKKMAMAAANYALNEYEKLTEVAMSQDVLTDGQLQALHQELAKSIAHNFVGFFKSPTTENDSQENLSGLSQPWENELTELKVKLHQKMAVHLRENSKKLTKVKIKRKIACREAENSYKEKLREIFSKATETHLKKEKLFLHKAANAAEKVAKQTFVVETTNVPESLRRWWWEVMRSTKFVEIQKILYGDACRDKNIPEGQFSPVADPLTSNFSLENDNDQNDYVGNIGVSIYFSHDLTRVGIYQNGFMSLPDSLAVTRPIVAISGSQIFFDNEATGAPQEQKVDLFDLVTDSKNDPIIKVPLQGKVYLLRTEELLGIFFRHLKHKIESHVSEVNFETKVIFTCTLVLDISLSTIARIRLKNALKLAGFVGSTLMHSTTAIGLSYILGHQNSNQEKHHVLLLHRMTSSMDVALGHVSSKSLLIKSMSNWRGKVTDESVVRNIQHILTASSSRLTYQELTDLSIVLVGPIQGENPMKIELVNPRTQLTNRGYPRHVQTASEDAGILMGSSHWESQKKEPELGQTLYKEARAFSLAFSTQRVSYWGRDWKQTLDKWGPMTSGRHTFFASVLKIKEIGREEEQTVAIYKTNSGQNGDFQLSIDPEGFFVVRANDQLLKSLHKDGGYMDDDEIVKAAPKIVNILKLNSIAAKISARGSQGMKQSQVSALFCEALENIKISGPGAVNEEKREPPKLLGPCEDLKEKLKILMEKIEGKLASGKHALKNPLILDRIKDLLQESGKLLEDGSKVTERILKRTLQNLETYGDKLKV